MFVDEGTTYADSALRHHGLDGHGRQAGNNREIHSDDTNVLLRQIEVGLILSPLLWGQGACHFVLGGKALHQLFDRQIAFANALVKEVEGPKGHQASASQ